MCLALSGGLSVELETIEPTRNGAWSAVSARSQAKDLSRSSPGAMSLRHSYLITEPATKTHAFMEDGGGRAAPDVGQSLMLVAGAYPEALTT